MKRAFSLLESLIASFTLGLAMTMLMMLVHQYLRVASQSQEQLLALAPRLKLVEVAEESRLALEVLEPLVGASSSRLSLQRLRPAALPQIGNDPWPATRQMTVTFHLVGDELWRQWEWPGQVSQQELLVSGCREFRVGQPQAGRLSLQLNGFQEEVRLWRQ